MQSERIATKMSEKVETFYQQKDYSNQTEGNFFAAGFDDKGVPIRAGSLGREAGKTTMQTTIRKQNRKSYRNIEPIVAKAPGEIR